jgi:DUF1365 family protein
MYLDLGELPELFRERWLWSSRGPNLARFRREDHYGDPAQPLDQAIRDLVKARSGRRPVGPVRLLTHLRYFGLGFNPVSFYYCFEADGETLAAIVAEVNNTPWGEQHCYVLPANENLGSPERPEFEQAKQFHVSPFMDLAMHYRWRLTRPARRLAVHIENHQDGNKLFDATLSLERKPITGVTLAGVLVRFPLITAKVLLTIHFEALRLWLKKTPIHDHPAKKEARETL